MTDRRRQRGLLHVGQLNLPPFAMMREALEGIFERDFYTNHGPLERQLDAALAERLDVVHAISMVNGTVALTLLLQALDLKKVGVIVPAFTFPATVQAIHWAGLRPIFCDVDRETHNLTADLVAKRLSEVDAADVGAILGTHVWGRVCDPLGLEEVARERGLRLVFDAAHAIGCASAGRTVGNFGDAEMFSFHATKVLSGLEGGCIATNDDVLAERLRTMRSFHDRPGAPRDLLRFNAKISEAQAAMLLLGLDRLEGYVEDNRRRYASYREELSFLPGVRFIDHAAGQMSNFQYVVIEIDAPAFGVTRDELVDILRDHGVLARRYFNPSVHKLPPFDTGITLPNTDNLCETLIQLPTGQAVSDDDVVRVCTIIRSAALRGGEGR